MKLTILYLVSICRRLAFICLALLFRLLHLVLNLRGLPSLPLVMIAVTGLGVRHILSVHHMPVICVV